jgi:GNAT superfamily N-acetyltransferase
MITTHNDYELDDNFDRIDFDAVHALLTNSYWSPGITKEKVEKGATHSALCIAAYWNGELIGFTRVVSDRSRFAYICDVFVRQDHQRRGIGRAMVKHAMLEPDLAPCRWMLATKDAHGVYASLGFVTLSEPERWMTYKPTEFMDCLAENDETCC